MEILHTQVIDTYVFNSLNVVNFDVFFTEKNDFFLMVHVNKNTIQ